jgi:hypothetical protein
MTLPPTIQRVWHFFAAYEPMRHARWELVLMRVIIALLVWDTQTGWVSHLDDPPAIVQAVLHNAQTRDFNYESQPHPNGLGMWFDLTWLSEDNIEKPLRAAVAVSLLLYALGVPSALSLLVPLFFGVASSTLANSQGAIGHTSQVLHLTLLSLWLAGLGTLWCRWRKKPLANGFSAGEFEASWARQGIMAGYVVSGISKLLFSEGSWLTSARYLPLHIVKNRDMELYDKLDANAVSLEWLPQLMMEHPVWCIVIFGLALPMELFAFLGLCNRRSAAFFGLGLIAFHETVTQLMSLSFIFNKALLLVFFVAPWWWAVRLFQRKPVQ